MAGNQTLPLFCDYVFAKLPPRKKRNLVAISHNGGRYDMVMILRHMLDNGIKPTKFLQKGTKIIINYGSGRRHVQR
jgi:hypothetical protein